MHIVFIGGAQRSGTTLVQTLVANSLGNAAVLPEAHVVYELLQVYKRGIDEWSKTAHFFEDQSGFREYIRSCIGHINNSIIRIHGPSEFLVLKEPNFALVQDRISELFPEATSLFCARDPRDIVCSFLKIERREADLNRRRKNYSGRNIAFYCSKIKKSCQDALNPNFPAIVVKYEDIAADPRGELMRLAAETGLPLSLPDLDNMRWAEAEIRHKRSWVSPLEERKPSTESIGWFRECLSPDEIAYVERTCGPVLARFDYTPLTPKYGRRFPFGILSRLWHSIRTRSRKPG